MSNNIAAVLSFTRNSNANITQLILPFVMTHHTCLWLASRTFSSFPFSGNTPK